MRFHPLTVRAVRPETPDAYTVEFERPADEAFNYLPGQYLTLKLQVNGEDLRRAYSLSSCPTVDPHLSITVKRVEQGRASNFLGEQISPGDTIEVFPPMGKFTVDCKPDNAKHYILIGGGSGITPLMSILKAVLQDEPQSRVSLLYGNTNQNSIIFQEELERLQAKHGQRLEVEHILSRPEAGWNGPKGRIEGRTAYELLAPMIQQQPELKKNFYLCGPSGMMESAMDVLEILSVAPSLIHREYYSAPVETPEEEGYESMDPDDLELTTQEVEVRLDGIPYKVTVTPEQYILDAAIEADIDPPYACQEGVCTTCRAKVHSGLVSMDEREGLSDSEIENGYILTCQAHPLSDDVVVEFS